jgi:hypothetical protein
LNATADTSFTRVVVNFSEPVEATSALDEFNYSLQAAGGPVLVPTDAVYGANQSQVILTTPLLAQESTYTLTIVNPIADQSAAGNEVPAGTTTTFSTPALVTGFIPRDWYAANAISPMDGVGGAPNGGSGGVMGSPVDGNPLTPVNLNEITSIPGYPDAPKWTCWNNIFQLNTVDQAENFGARISGVFIPRESGNHTFYISADDGAALFLSTDASPASKVQICR